MFSDVARFNKEILNYLQYLQVDRLYENAVNSWFCTLNFLNVVASLLRAIDAFEVD